jgi:phosphate transport system permease protein
MRNFKFIEEKIFRVLMFFSTVFIVTALALIIFSILHKGLPVLSWEMVSQTPKGGFYFGKEGGILNAIVGSFYLSVSATLLAFLFLCHWHCS